jgi:hypothetical protein
VSFSRDLSTRVDRFARKTNTEEQNSEPSPDPKRELEPETRNPENQDAVDIRSYLMNGKTLLHSPR